VLNITWLNRPPRACSHETALPVAEMETLTKILGIPQVTVELRNVLYGFRTERFAS